MRPTPTFLGPRPPAPSYSPAGPSTHAPAPLTHLAAIDLLPFSLAHDGPANVADYFHPTPRASTSSSGAPPAAGLVPLQAAFRGRLVCSSPLALPHGYTGLVFSTTAPAPTAPPPAKASAGKRAAPGASSAARPAKRLSLSAVAKPPGGSRRSPRKAVRAAYQLDSDDDEGSDKENGGGIKTEVEEEDRAEVLIEIEEKVVEAAAAPVAVAPLSLSANPSLMIEPPSSPPAKADADIKADDDGALERDVKHLVPVATFGGLHVWNADFGLANLDDDVYAKGLGEWIRLAEMVSPCPAVSESQGT